LNSLGPFHLPFAIPEAGFDYFATQTHYRSLSNRILTASGGFNVVVVTGDQLPSGPLIGTALSEAAAGRYTVIGLQCRPELGRQDTMRSHTVLSAPSSRGSSIADRNSEVPALIVFYDTDRYSDRQIEKTLELVHQRVRIGDHPVTAAVFLARSEFLSRLEHPMLRAWLANRLLAARVRFYELGADEIAAFIRHQLPASEAEQIFTDEAIAAIANVSGGDPEVVNRFSRRMLDCAAVSIGNTRERADVGSATVMSPHPPGKETDVTRFADRLPRNFTASEPNLPLWARMWRAGGVSLKLGGGMALCLVCVAVVAAIAFLHPVTEDVAASNPAPTASISTKLPAHTLRSGGAPLDLRMVITTEEPTAVPGKAALTAMSASAEPTPEDALADKTAALPPSVATLRSTAEPAMPTEAAKTVVDAGIPSAPSSDVATTATAVSPTAMHVLSLTTSNPDPPPTQLRAADAAVPPAASITLAPISTPAPPTGMHAPTSTSSMPVPPPALLRLPEVEIAALLARGDASFALGDVSSARLFYERAAEAGEGRAALRLGHTFDPVFLDFAHSGVRGDVSSAEAWYRRARELGETGAEILLTAAHRQHQNELNAAQRVVPSDRRVTAAERFKNVTTKKSALAAGSKYGSKPSDATQTEPEPKR
jgi:hypothetical protein